MMTISKSHLIDGLLDAGVGFENWVQGQALNRARVIIELTDYLLSEPQKRTQVLKMADDADEPLEWDTVEGRLREYVETVSSVYIIVRLVSKNAKAKQEVKNTIANMVKVAERHAGNERGVSRPFIEAVAAYTQVRGRVVKGYDAARYALIAAVISGYNDGDPIFRWGKRNLRYLAATIPQVGVHHMKNALSEPGYPVFDLAMTGRGTPSESIRIIVFDTDSEFCRDVLINSLDFDGHSPAYISLVDPYFKEFTQSLGYVPQSMDDFDVEAFTKQSLWFEGKSNGREAGSSHRFMRRFWSYIMSVQTKDQSKFTLATGLVPVLIHHKSIFKLWNEGYRAVLRNPLDKPPAFTKWMLLPSEDEMAKTNIRPDPWAMDVGYHDEVIQRAVVNWIWTECDNVAAIRRLPKELYRFFTFAEEADKPCRLVSASSVAKYIASRGDELGKSGLRHLKGWMRSFFRYCESLGEIRVEKACYMLLSVSEKSNRWQPDEGAAIDLDSLAKVASVLEARSAKSTLEELCYLAFCIQSLSSLRIGDVLAIRRDEVIVDRSGRVTAVEKSTKQDGYDRRLVTLHPSAARALETAVALTEKYANLAQGKIGRYVFIYPAHELGNVKKILPSEYTLKLRLACASAGIEPFTSRNVRRRYETEIVVEGIKMNLSRLALKPLTGHISIKTTERYYVREDMRNYLEAVHGIEIGVPEIRGAIACEDQAAEHEADKVENGAGYCLSDSCNVAGMTTCLMCNGFMTTPSCIPEMESALAAVEARMAEPGVTLHERDHLLAVKRLFLGYLSAMYSMREV